MGKRVRAYKVTKLEDVDKTLYIEGDIFIDDEKAGILTNGEIQPLLKDSDLSLYAKKSTLQKNYAKKTDIEDFTTEERVQEMIDEALKDFTTEERVQEMIDEALKG